jgi:hypothetical protein
MTPDAQPDPSPDDAAAPAAPAGTPTGNMADLIKQALRPGMGAPTVFTRDVPQPDEARAALVSKMTASVKADRAHWADVFKHMKKCASLARTGADPRWAAEGLYVTNIMQRHVLSKTAALYAKNPTIRAERRRTRDFQIWDGTAATLQAAMSDPVNGPPLLQDVQRGTMRRKMLDGVSDTLQIVASYQLDEQRPPFKTNMKKMVTRAIITGVGYVKLGYQRQMEPAPETITETSNLEARLASVEQLMADLADDKINELSAQAEELRLAMNELQTAPMQVTDEGLRFDFPESWAIIPDRGLTDLRGFQGCDVVTEEYLWTADEVESMFGIDVTAAGGGSKPIFYHGTEDRPLQYNESSTDDDIRTKRRVCVWCSYVRKDGLMYWMVDGYKDFLTEPCPPPITLRRFWPWFALTLNISEDEKHPYPPTDIELIKHQQNEINRARQGLRDHRIANRPKYVTPRGALDDDDKDAITRGASHSMIELNGMMPGQKVDDILQAVKHAGIDPSLYDTSQAQKDIQLAVGEQSADMGATSGVTATEASAAENARMSAMGSNIDDIDMLLTELVQEAGHVLLLEMDTATVTKIAGPAAVWPSISPEDVMHDVGMTIEAGSSGRPNKQADIAAFERIAPLLMQIPGINPTALAKEAIKRMDDKLDPSDFVLDGVPSILAMQHIQQTQQTPGPTQPPFGAPGGAPPPVPIGAGVPTLPVNHPGGGAPPGAGAPPGMRPPGMPGAPPGAPNLPPPGVTPHPAGPRLGNPGPLNNPANQGMQGANNIQKPPGAVMQPPARPGPGSGVVVAGRGNY